MGDATEFMLCESCKNADSIYYCDMCYEYHVNCLANGKYSSPWYIEINDYCYDESDKCDNYIRVAVK